MNSDIIVFIIIAVSAILVVCLLVYFMAKKRSDHYIIYADTNGIKTLKDIHYNWSDLKRIHYINKYVLGKGRKEKNYALVFHFSKGKATIDINSNIYREVYTFADKLNCHRTSVVTKGLIREQ